MEHAERSKSSQRELAQRREQARVRKLLNEDQREILDWYDEICPPVDYSSIPEDAMERIELRVVGIPESLAYHEFSKRRAAREIMFGRERVLV